jgi:hypothetical protein
MARKSGIATSLGNTYTNKDTALSALFITMFLVGVGLVGINKIFPKSSGWFFWVGVFLAALGFVLFVAHNVNEWKQKRAYDRAVLVDKEQSHANKVTEGQIKGTKLVTAEYAQHREFERLGKEKHQRGYWQEKERAELAKAGEVNAEPLEWSEVIGGNRLLRIIVPTGHGKTATIPELIAGHAEAYPGERTLAQLLTVDASIDTDERIKEGVLNPLKIPILGWEGDAATIKSYIIWNIADTRAKMAGKAGGDYPEILNIWDEWNSFRSWCAMLGYNKDLEGDRTWVTENFENMLITTRKSRKTNIMLMQANNSAMTGLVGYSHQFAEIPLVVIAKNFTAKLIDGGAVHEIKRAYKGRDVMSEIERAEWEENQGVIRPRNVVRQAALDEITLGWMDACGVKQTPRLFPGAQADSAPTSEPATAYDGIIQAAAEGERKRPKSDSELKEIEDKARAFSMFDAGEHNEQSMTAFCRTLLGVKNPGQSHFKKYRAWLAEWEGEQAAPVVEPAPVAPVREPEHIAETAPAEQLTRMEEFFAEADKPFRAISDNGRM